MVRRESPVIDLLHEWYLWQAEQKKVSARGAQLYRELLTARCGNGCGCLKCQRIAQALW